MTLTWAHLYSVSPRSIWLLMYFSLLLILSSPRESSSCKRLRCPRESPKKASIARRCWLICSRWVRQSLATASALRVATRSWGKTRSTSICQSLSSTAIKGRFGMGIWCGAEWSWGDWRVADEPVRRPLNGPWGSMKEGSSTREASSLWTESLRVPVFPGPIGKVKLIL